MKKHLINLWFDYYDMRAVGKENYAFRQATIARIESILYKRYGFDIALKYNFI